MSFVGFTLPSSDSAHFTSQRPATGSVHQTSFHAPTCPRTFAGLCRRQVLRKSSAKDALCTLGKCSGRRSTKHSKSAARTSAVASELNEKSTEETARPVSENPSSEPTPAATPTSEAPSTSNASEQVTPQQPAAAQPGDVPSRGPTPHREQQRTARTSYDRNQNYQPAGPKSSQRQNFAPRQRETGPALIPVPESERGWIQPGETVVCKVVYSNMNGFKVAMLKDERIGGWCPIKEAPYLLRDEDAQLKLDTSDPAKLNPDIMPVGTVREFLIVKTPADPMYNGTGPLVSARLHDLKVLWQRTFQLFDTCNRDKETLKVRVLDANQGGLLCRVFSLQAFIPISQLAKERETWLSLEDMSKLIGKDVDVTVIEVEEEFKKIVLSMSRAEQYHQLQQIHLGALMWGEVRRIEEFGAFVGLEGTRVSGLLHISNISRSRVETVDEIFHLGERVRCLVMGMDDNFTRISLSTAELEEQNGDMLFDKEKVYANADAQAKLFLEYVQSSQDQGDFDFDGDREYDGGSYDSDFAGNARSNAV